MENQEKLQYIKSKVIEVCPEVRAFSFGCRFGFKNGLQNAVVISSHTKETEFLADWRMIGSKYGVLKTKDLLGEIEIIGHPITLSHILRTIQCKGMFSLTDMGEFLNDVGDKRFTNIFWNLEKDNLDQQKPEVIDFLYTLLK